MKRALFFLLAALSSGVAHPDTHGSEINGSEPGACASESCVTVEASGKVSLRFSSIKIRALLSILADVSGLYFYATGSVDGYTSVLVSDAPWSQVLNSVVKKHRWTWRQVNDSIIVGPEAEVEWVIERKVFR
jgi:type II secretory pathway component HofQ